MAQPPALRAGWAAAALCFAAAALATAPAAAAAAPDAPFRAPYLPADDAVVLQEVPAAADPAVVRIRALRARLDAAPQSMPAALALADAFVDYGRQVGDAHYAGYAEAVIAPWMAGHDPAPGVLLTEANILQYRHQFAEARGLLQRVLHAEPANAQAWLTIATLDMVQGDHRAAGRDCVQVTAAGGFGLGLACAGQLRSYRGQARQALVLLGQVEAGGGALPPAFQAWVEGLLAEAAERLGDWPLAEAHYRKALRLLPQDNFLLVSYADFLLDRGRAGEVPPLLADHLQSDTAYLRVALAQSALHGADAPRYTWVMAARFEALRARGSDFFGREEARFALQLQHDPETALEMAQSNWRLQREPWDVRVLLEAALAAHRPQAAAPVLEFLRETKLEDPVIEPLARTLQAQLAPPVGAAR